MACGIVGVFALGWYMVDLTYYDDLYTTLPHFHKSIGLLLGILFVGKFIWKWVNPKPLPMAGVSSLELIGTKLAHLSLNCLIAAIVISGYLISSANGASIDVFNLFSVPATVTGIPEQEDTAGVVHKYLAYGIIGIAALHAAAALKHHFINRDDTLRRMLGMALTRK